MNPLDKTVEHELSEIYVAHHSWLKGWLRSRLGTAGDSAADFAQETFLRLITRLRRERVREPRAYLVTIASGLLTDYRRRQAVEQAWLQTAAAHGGETQCSVEERYLILETLQRVAALLEKMTTRDREIFLLSQFDGLSYPVIAQQLGVSVNVVQKAMVRALGHCYRILYEE